MSAREEGYPNQWRNSRPSPGYRNREEDYRHPRHHQQDREYVNHMSSGSQRNYQRDRQYEEHTSTGHQRNHRQNRQYIDHTPSDSQRNHRQDGEYFDHTPLDLQRNHRQDGEYFDHTPSGSQRNRQWDRQYEQHEQTDFRGHHRQDRQYEQQTSKGFQSQRRQDRQYVDHTSGSRRGGHMDIKGERSPARNRTQGDRGGRGESEKSKERRQRSRRPAQELYVPRAMRNREPDHEHQEKDKKMENVVKEPRQPDRYYSPSPGRPLRQPDTQYSSSPGRPPRQPDTQYSSSPGRPPRQPDTQYGPSPDQSPRQPETHYSSSQGRSPGRSTKDTHRDRPERGRGHNEKPSSKSRDGRRERNTKSRHKDRSNYRDEHTVQNMPLRDSKESFTESKDKIQYSDRSDTKEKHTAQNLPLRGYRRDSEETVNQKHVKEKIENDEESKTREMDMYLAESKHADKRMVTGCDKNENERETSREAVTFSEKENQVDHPKQGGEYESEGSFISSQTRCEEVGDVVDDSNNTSPRISESEANNRTKSNIRDIEKGASIPKHENKIDSYDGNKSQNTIQLISNTPDMLYNKEKIFNAHYDERNISQDVPEQECTNILSHGSDNDESRTMHENEEYPVHSESENNTNNSTGENFSGSTNSSDTASFTTKEIANDERNSESGDVTESSTPVVLTTQHTSELEITATQDCDTMRESLTYSSNTDIIQPVQELTSINHTTCDEQTSEESATPSGTTQEVKIPEKPDALFDNTGDAEIAMKTPTPSGNIDEVKIQEKTASPMVNTNEPNVTDETVTSVGNKSDTESALEIAGISDEVKIPEKTSVGNTNKANIADETVTSVSNNSDTENALKVEGNIDEVKIQEKTATIVGNTDDAEIADDSKTPEVTVSSIDNTGNANSVPSPSQDKTNILTEVEEIPSLDEANIAIATAASSGDAGKMQIGVGMETSNASSEIQIATESATLTPDIESNPDTTTLMSPEIDTVNPVLKSEPCEKSDTATNSDSALESVCNNDKLIESETNTETHKSAESQNDPKKTMDDSPNQNSPIKATGSSMETSNPGKDSKENEEEDDSWDTLFDDSGECLNEDSKKELSKQVRKKKSDKSVVVQKAEFDYYNYQPKDNFDYSAFSHVIEVYDFPPELKTEDILMAFKQYKTQGFDIKWIDETHALAIFSSKICANDALEMKNPLLKTRPLMMATKEAKTKARKCVDFLQPYKARPETSAMAARRLVSGALGISMNAPKAKRDEERRKLREAKDKKREEKKQIQDIWEGNV